MRYLLLIGGVVVVHLIEVNVIDAGITQWIAHDFAATIQSIEGDTVLWFSQHWNPVLVTFFVLIYIGVYPFTLWFSPLYCILTDAHRAMKTLAYGLLLIYCIALPFYLFFPVTNVYTFYSLNSALNTVIPTVDQFFYATTTQNNCFPSLHVAMSILVARAASLTGNKRLTYFMYGCSIGVIISVIYLAIHWITDVVFGGFLALAVIMILNQCISEE